MLPPRQPTTPVSGRVECAVAVVGAGLVGLACARRLAELAPASPVVLLDAGEIGQGAAGRNSGFTIDAPLSHAMGAAHALGGAASVQLRLARDAYTWLDLIVHREHIACGWHRSGRYYAAATDRGERSLSGLVEQFAAQGEAAETVGAESLADRLGTHYYQAAVFNQSCTLVQPAALARGLANSLPATVRLHENSRVTDWQSKAGRHLLTTAGGVVQASKVVWATHTDLSAFTSLGRRYLTLYTYVGLTPRLNDDELGGGSLVQWGVLPALRAGSTVRRLPDGRILLRSLWSYGRQFGPNEIRGGLQPLLAARFPVAAPRGFEYVWGGPVSITRHADPWIGEVRSGAYAYTGCNGSGIVKGSAYGRLLAELVCGLRSEALTQALAERNASWIPPEPLRRVAVHFTLARNARHSGGEV